MGAKTALVQNRPVLGGNCSIELGVGVNGSGGEHPGWLETGIIGESNWITANERKLNHTSAFTQLCEAEENLTVFNNQHVFEALMKNKKEITGVRAVSTLTGLISEYSAKMFIDCSGDGWLGYFAGAEYRYGREASSEFNESLAPKESDKVTMSGCIMGEGLGYMTTFNAVKTDNPVDFVRPVWVKEIDILTSPRRKINGVPTTGTWWLEHDGLIDDTMQAEEARDELIKVSFAFWDFVKNKSKNAKEARNYKLRMIPIVDAKRESRRLVGDYMVNQNDVQTGRMFSDRIAYSGWDLDIHHPKGIYSGKEGSLDFKVDVPLNSVPFRSVYSKNIDNLLMAGRCLSYTHVALGTVRVQGTLALVGEAAGTAAAMCVDKDVMPRTLGKKHITELQQTLLKNDMSIPGIKNEDSDDLAKTATVTASSFAKADSSKEPNINSSRAMPLSVGRSVIVSVKRPTKLDYIRVYLESNNSSAQDVKVNLAGLKGWTDFKDSSKIGTYTVTVPAKSKGWIKVPVAADIYGAINFLQISLAKASGINWPLMDAEGIAGGRTYEKTVNKDEFHAAIVSGEKRTVSYKPANVINGWDRMVENKESMWKSDSAQSLPQWIELDFEKATTVDTVQLTFVTKLDGLRQKLPYAPQTVKDYELQALVDGEWKNVAAVKGNYRRHRIHTFDALDVEKLRVNITATNGTPEASVYEIRAYDSSAEKVSLFSPSSWFGWMK